ncbi:MAG: helix-turn-helix transcriptional regulator [Bacteriovoracia bacterium]
MENRVRKCRQFYNERNPDFQISQADVARLLGVTPQAYSKIERGITVPRIDTAIKLARIFKVKPEALFVVPTESIERVRRSFGFSAEGIT